MVLRVWGVETNVWFIKRVDDLGKLASERDLSVDIPSVSTLTNQPENCGLFVFIL